MFSKKVTPRNAYILRLEKGEVVHDTIVTFCAKQNIRSGWFTALGAIESIELGYYDLEKREYFFTEYPSAHEVVTMVGNVTYVDMKPFLHIHTTISDTQNTAFGGHLKSARVAVTLEVRLEAFDEQIGRTYVDEIGLKLCHLE